MEEAKREKIIQISQHIEQILKLLGLTPENDPELKHTPGRAAEFFVELLSGNAVEPELTCLDHPGDSREMIVISHIPFYSLCVHHWLPFYGRAHIAYVPNSAIAGFGGIARIVEHFARRLQLQERLTDQVADYLQRALAARGVMVMLEARHLCMEMRGRRAPGWVTTTTARGCFQDRSWREEFFARLRTLPEEQCQLGSSECDVHEASGLS